MTDVVDKIVLHKPILLENTQPGPTIFTDDQSKTNIVWEGAGDMGGGDIQAIPISYLNNINFLRILNRGILRVFEAPDDIKEMIDAQLASSTLRDQSVAWRSRQQEKTDTSAVNIERTTNKDFVTVRCIGPGSRQGLTCESEVPVRELNRGEKPALCSTHQNLANQFVPEVGENVNGKEEIHWILPRIVR